MSLPAWMISLMEKRKQHNEITCEKNGLVKPLPDLKIQRKNDTANCAFTAGKKSFGAAPQHAQKIRQNETSCNIERINTTEHIPRVSENPWIQKEREMGKAKTRSAFRINRSQSSDGVSRQNDITSRVQGDPKQEHAEIYRPGFVSLLCRKFTSMNDLVNTREESAKDFPSAGTHGKEHAMKRSSSVEQLLWMGNYKAKHGVDHSAKNTENEVEPVINSPRCDHALSPEPLSLRENVINGETNNNSNVHQEVGHRIENLLDHKIKPTVNELPKPNTVMCYKNFFEKRKQFTGVELLVKRTNELNVNHKNNVNISAQNCEPALKDKTIKGFWQVQQNDTAEQNVLLKNQKNLASPKKPNKVLLLEEKLTQLHRSADWICEKHSNMLSSDDVDNTEKAAVHKESKPNDSDEPSVVEEALVRPSKIVSKTKRQSKHLRTSVELNKLPNHVKRKPESAHESSFMHYISGNNKNNLKPVFKLLSVDEKAKREQFLIHPPSGQKGSTETTLQAMPALIKTPLGDAVRRGVDPKVVEKLRAKGKTYRYGVDVPNKTLSTDQYSKTITNKVVNNDETEIKFLPSDNRNEKLRENVVEQNGHLSDAEINDSQSVNDDHSAGLDVSGAYFPIVDDYASKHIDEYGFESADDDFGEYEDSFTDDGEITSGYGDEEDTDDYEDYDSDEPPSSSVEDLYMDCDEDGLYLGQNAFGSIIFTTLSEESEDQFPVHVEPCKIEFEGEMTVADGGSILMKERNKNLRIKFNESRLEECYEYPSEQYLLKYYDETEVEQKNVSAYYFTNEEADEDFSVRLEPHNDRQSNSDQPSPGYTSAKGLARYHPTSMHDDYEFGFDVTKNEIRVESPNLQTEPTEPVVVPFDKDALWSDDTTTSPELLF